MPFLQSVWLMDEALKKNKGELVQFMIYPGEFHYFSREHVLRDAWNRVDRFFALPPARSGPQAIMQWWHAPLTAGLLSQVKPSPRRGRRIQPQAQAGGF